MPADVGPVISTRRARPPAGFLDQLARRRRASSVSPATSSPTRPAGISIVRAQRHAVLLDEQHFVVRRDRDDDHRHAVGVGALDVFPVAAHAPCAATCPRTPCVGRSWRRRQWRPCDRCGAVASVRPPRTHACGLQAAARQRAEAQLSHSDPAGARRRRRACVAHVVAAAHRSAIVDRRRHSSACSRCARSFVAACARAAEAQVRHFVDAFEQRASSCRSAPSSTAAVLAPMPGTPGMLSTASPAQREVIGDLVRVHAVARLDAAAPQRWLRA
jgi:hypothetical protein